MTSNDSVSEDYPGGESTAPAHSAVRWIHRAGAREELLAEVERQLRARQRRCRTVAAGVAALTTVLALALTLRWSVPDFTPVAARTATVTLPDSRMLPDGSLADLKEGAQIEAFFSEQSRHIVLHSGEAHFRVVKDVRPFVVEASGIQVIAVGTAFSVQLAPGEVEVVVTEGRVQLAAGAALPGDPVAVQDASAVPSVTEPILEPGQRAIISLDRPDARIDSLSKRELAERLAWRIPRLEFSRTPLSEVVALMNSHAAGSDGRVFIIASSELEEVRLSGFIRADNTEGLVRLLESQFGVSAEVAADTIILRKL